MIETPDEEPFGEQPVLETERLRLRPLVVDDAPDVQGMAGEYDVAVTTGVMPHPYPDGLAEEWIATTHTGYAEGRSAEFAITLRSDGRLLGVCGLRIEREHDRGEIGYWIGKPFWGRGYATEAARILVDYAFRNRGLNRVEAWVFTHNSASVRVLTKAGLREEGLRRQYVKRFGVYRDVIPFGLVRDEFDADRSTGTTST